MIAAAPKGMPHRMSIPGLLQSVPSSRRSSNAMKHHPQRRSSGVQLVELQQNARRGSNRSVAGVGRLAHSFSRKSSDLSGFGARPDSRRTSSSVSISVSSAEVSGDLKSNEEAKEIFQHRGLPSQDEMLARKPYR